MMNCLTYYANRFRLDFDLFVIRIPISHCKLLQIESDRWPKKCYILLYCYCNVIFNTLYLTPTFCRDFSLSMDIHIGTIFINGRRQKYQSNLLKCRELVGIVNADCIGKICLNTIYFIFLMISFPINLLFICH